MAYNNLSSEETSVIMGKGTEAPFSGEYDNFYQDGTYICRRCNNPLFEALTKFDAQCGWPSFDDHFEGAVTRQTDADGRRTEILCANCGGHLGHVFEGKHMTDKDTRHCVNSLSIKFIPQGKELPPILHKDK